MKLRAVARSATLARASVCLVLLLAWTLPLHAQGLPNERAPTNRGAAAVDPESGLADSDAPSESDEQPRAVQQGQTNLPLPRYASLRSGEVNLRTGPGVRYPVDWVFQRRGLPIEIVAEFGTWRKIRDEQGAEGWVHRSMLAGKRTAVTIGAPGSAQTMRRSAENDSAAVAKLEPGVQVSVLECDGAWCRLEAHGFRGWLPSKGLWGIKAGERIK
ncbi:MAG TPA: SH3 domain-containing protein [Alphaproteobacteria bacterium]|jgi:SH3-like domain-containing protein